MQNYRVEEYAYSYIPKIYTTLQEDIDFDTFSLNQAGIYAVQNPPISLTGRGVMVGFIDTGIDYTKEVFRNADGTTRILGLWDQIIGSGTKPEGILYGTEYKREQINQALKSDDPYSVVPSRDENGHGTFMASVVCGSNIEENFTYLGAAPDEYILVVKLKEAKQYLKEYYLIDEKIECYQETDILAAVRYLNAYAVSLRRPLVICMALGSNQAEHSGDSKLAEFLSRVAEKKSRTIVTAGGNEGIAGHHYAGKLSPQEPTEVVEINVGSGVSGFFAKFWGQTPFLFGVKVRSPEGELTPAASLKTKQSQSFQFILDRSIITFDALTIEQNTGRLLIAVSIKNPSPGVWQIVVSNLTGLVGGEFDIYLPMTEMMTGEVVFLRPEPRSTLVNPSFSAQSITVVAYDSSTKSVSPASGRGYSLSGAVKPDLAVPGVNIPTILGRRSGSSYAAALAAGIAQLLQWTVIERMIF
ncbi:Ser-type protease [Lachnospiraceae bacterium KM106-2]|nr:Ser-type protease [Lachnospiraceae bacterium KM106-2]